MSQRQALNVTLAVRGPEMTRCDIDGGGVALGPACRLGSEPGPTILIHTLRKIRCWRVRVAPSLSKGGRSRNRPVLRPVRKVVGVEAMWTAYIRQDGDIDVLLAFHAGD